MQDPFEQSLRDLLREAPEGRDDHAFLDRVLKKANRQVGAGDLFGLMGRWAEALLIAVEQGSPNVAPRRRGPSSTHPNAKEAD